MINLNPKKAVVSELMKNQHFYIMIKRGNDGRFD